MLRVSRDRSKQKQEVDYLQAMLDELRKSQELDKIHKSIPLDDNYLERLEEKFNKYDGLQYYESFERYLKVTVVPYLKKQNIDIGDLK